MEKKKVLFISQEIKPFLPNSDISETTRILSQGVQENGKEIRIFMPRFGVINERRHQLHEVIRLSGMNLIVNDIDHPLIIKVASIPVARMQVYFIDNDEYFKRKNTYLDDKNNEFADNDERTMFFCRGVLETVKKLGWKPDVIHCHGNMTSLMPMYIKDVYKNDPHFVDTKIVYSIYNKGFNKNWEDKFEEKLKFEGFNDSIIEAIKDGSYTNINKLAMEYADGLILGSDTIEEDLKAVFDASEKLKMEYVEGGVHPKEVSEFFDKVISEEALIQ